MMRHDESLTVDSNAPSVKSPARGVRDAQRGSDAGIERTKRLGRLLGVNKLGFERSQRELRVGYGIDCEVQLREWRDARERAPGGGRVQRLADRLTRGE